jgi:hypothetical protein
MRFSHLLLIPTDPPLGVEDFGVLERLGVAEEGIGGYADGDVLVDKLAGDGAAAFGDYAPMELAGRTRRDSSMQARR